MLTILAFVLSFSSSGVADTFGQVTDTFGMIGMVVSIPFLLVAVYKFFVEPIMDSNWCSVLFIGIGVWFAFIAVGLAFEAFFDFAGVAGKVMLLIAGIGACILGFVGLGRENG